MIQGLILPAITSLRSLISVFLIFPIANCSERFIAGAFANTPGQAHPLLTYAFPTSGDVKIASGATARIVVIYDKAILASSFIATMNSQAITQLFIQKLEPWNQSCCRQSVATTFFN